MHYETATTGQNCWNIIWVVKVIHDDNTALRVIRDPIETKRLGISRRVPKAERHELWQYVNVWVWTEGLGCQNSQSMGIWEGGRVPTRHVMSFITTWTDVVSMQKVSNARSRKDCSVGAVDGGYLMTDSTFKTIPHLD